MAHGHGVLIGPSGTYAGLWSQGMQTVGVYTWYVGAKYEVSRFVGIIRGVIFGLNLLLTIISCHGVCWQ